MKDRRYYWRQKINLNVLGNSFSWPREKPMRISLITCLSGLLLALSLVGSALVAALQTPDEAQLSALAQNFYDTWAGEDLDGFLRLFSAQSPELTARKKAAQELFASSEKITLQGFALRQIKLNRDKATVRFETETLVIEAKAGKEQSGYGKRLRTPECVKEAGQTRELMIAFHRQLRAPAAKTTKAAALGASGSLGLDACP